MRILVLSFGVKLHMRLCHGNLGDNLLRSYIHPEIQNFLCYLRKKILKRIFWINNVDESVGPEIILKITAFYSIYYQTVLNLKSIISFRQKYVPFDTDSSFGLLLAIL